MQLNTESLNLTNYMALPGIGNRLGNNRRQAMVSKVSQEGSRGPDCPFQRKDPENTNDNSCCTSASAMALEAASAGGHKI